MKTLKLFYGPRVDKRSLLTGAVALSALALSRCATSSTSSPTTAIQQAATDITTTSTALQAALTPATLTSLGLSASTTSQISGLVSTLTSDATSIASAVNAATTPASTTLSEVSSAITAIANTVLPFVPGGSVIEMAVDAAVALLPTFLAAFGLAGAPYQMPTAKPKAGAPTEFNADSARVFLKGLANG